MVKEVSVPIFRCPLCDNRYRTEMEAEDCLRECSDTGWRVEEEELTWFVCEPCGAKFKEKKDAEECEQEHIEHQDKLFVKWQAKLEKERLLKIGNHPNQKKLAEVA